MTVHFKVCCIRSADEAALAVAAGAAAVGLVGEMPNGPGQISDDDIREIAASVHRSHGDKIWTALLTSRTDGAAIADHIAATGVNTVQIVDAPASGAYAVIRKAHAHIRLMQVIHVEDAGAIETARQAAQSVDVILLDSGKPSTAARTLGGTGDTHDWTISRQIIEAVRVPVFLAGGLGPDNVAEAVAAVGPYGVDICSGIRDKTDGYRLVPEKLEAFAGALGQISPR
ncbi:MAG: phosphoribosylanthranilate isomerase [Alphaproteobacteria bacterium]|nr:phosphoribosylanthranilate isomerase [Alphaproteobacteria bacterium]